MSWFGSMCNSRLKVCPVHTNLFGDVWQVRENADASPQGMSCDLPQPKALLNVFTRSSILDDYFAYFVEECIFCHILYFAFYEFLNQPWNAAVNTLHFALSYLRMMARWHSITSLVPVNCCFSFQACWCLCLDIQWIYVSSAADWIWNIRLKQ